MESTSTTAALTLAGKIAIVTGASRGIGAAIALELAERGAKVAITYVSPSSEKLAQDVVGKISSLGNGASAIAIRADMAEPDSADRIVAATLAAFGPAIDILVNNAGVTGAQRLGEITLDEYSSCFAVNVRGVVLLTQAILPHLHAPGRIINISSIGSRVGVPAVSVYLATKGALEVLTRCWAAELGQQGHTVNAVAPGTTQSDMLASAAGAGAKPDGAHAHDATAFQKMMTPMEHRLGTAADIAPVVAMIAEPRSQWITGQTISASGGMLML